MTVKIKVYGVRINPSPFVTKLICFVFLPLMLVAGVYAGYLGLTVMSHYLGIGMGWSFLLFALLTFSFSLTVNGKEKTFQLLPDYGKQAFMYGLCALCLYTFFLQDKAFEFGFSVLMVIHTLLGILGERFQAERDKQAALLRQQRTDKDVIIADELVL